MLHSSIILGLTLAICISTHPIGDSNLLQNKALDDTRVQAAYASSSELAPFPTLPPDTTPTTTWIQPAPAAATTTWTQPAPAAATTAWTQPAPAAPTTTYIQPTPAAPTTTYIQPAPAAPTTTYAQTTQEAPTTTYFATVVVTSTPTPPTQSCSANNHGLINSYSVLIRVPYEGSNGCNVAYDILESWIPISSWQCVQADGNYTQLWFNAVINRAGQINGALKAIWPNVAGGFNCPNR